MYSIPPQSHIESAKKFISSLYGCPIRAASRVPSTASDCVATTASSQPPLMPSSSGGLRSLMVNAVKIA